MKLLLPSNWTQAIVFVIAFATLFATALPFAAALPSASAEVESAGAYLDLLRDAQAHSQAQNWAEAAPLWERVVEINPTVAWFWYELGTAWFNASEHRKAIPALEKARELGAGSINIKPAYDVARAFGTLGERDSTLAWLERALDDGFRSREKIRSEEAFKFLQEDAHFKELADVVDTTKMSRDEGWRHDLSFLETEIKRMHSSPFGKVSQADFEREGRELRKDIPNLTDNQVIVGLIRWMSKIGDGHTGCFPDMVPTWNESVPLQFEFFDEGLYIISADRSHAKLVGTRVLQFGDHKVEQVVEALDAMLQRDNAQGLLRNRVNFMRYPQFMNGLGLLPDAKRMPLTVQDTRGKERTVTVAAVANEPEFNRIAGHPKWVTAYESAPGPLPRHLKDRRVPYWFEQLPDSKTVYFQFNIVTDTQTETLSDFVNRLFAFVDEQKIENLIIDLRWNNGGNTKLLPPLIQSLIRCDPINREGHLFVITGRYTYSAGMNAATLIERNADAIFVGEPTPSSPNFVGESNLITLPYSQVRASISDLYWQSSWPTDRRTWVAPLLYTPPTFEAYRAKRDPAMEAILVYGEKDSRLEAAAEGKR